ncbi:MAG: hypothetical protein Q8P67_09765 [archaeon]|nr:hypothetical protein [archaeon]
MGATDVVVPMRPLPQLEGRFRTTFLPKNFEQLRPWVARFGSARAINHTFAIDAKAMLGEQVWAEYVTISSVRNPFDAMVSEYFYIQDFLLHPLSCYLFCLFFTWFSLSFCPWVLSVAPLMRLCGWLYALCRRFEDLLFPFYWHTFLRATDCFGAPGMGELTTFRRDWIARASDPQHVAQSRFGAFVSNLFALYADKNSDFHHPNQHRMILDEHGEVVPLDFYIRFERMQEDFDQVCSALRIPPTPVVWLKRGGSARGRKKVHYSYYFDDATRDLIASENSTLINKFNYHFESKKLT